MGRFFNPETPFWQAVARLADLVLLNLLTLVFSFPVVTIGAAMTALYDCSWRLSEDRGGGTVRMFWLSFKENFARATALWAIVLLPGLGLAWLWQYWSSPVLAFVAGTLTFIYILTFPFIWVLQGKFDNSVVRTLKNAVRIALGRFPYSFGILVIWISCVGLVVVVAWQLPQALPPLVLLGLALPAYGSIPLLKSALRPWLPAQSSES